MGWPELLDRLEAEAEALRGLAVDPAASDALPAPVTLEASGPLPRHLAARAAAVQAALDAAAASVADARDRVAAEMAALHHEVQPEPSRYIDTSA